MLMNLELRKEYDRIKDQEQNVSAFELTQEEINKCIMKEEPALLGTNLTKMVGKLTQVKKSKEKEYLLKKRDLEKCCQVVRNDNLITIRNDAVAYKEKADAEKKEVIQMSEQAEYNDIQLKVTQQTIDDEASQIMQLKLRLETEKNKVQQQSNIRYNRLLKIEEQNDTIQQFMADKTKLLKGKKDMTELMQSMEDDMSMLENMKGSGAAKKSVVS